MVKRTTYPTTDGTVELQTRFSSGNMRVESGDGSLYAAGDRVTITPWSTRDGLSDVKVWKNGSITTSFSMKDHVAQRFGVECAHENIDVEF